MLRDLNAADRRVDASSPVTNAMLSAGINPEVEVSAATVTSLPAVLCVRVPSSLTTLRFYSLDRQIVHLSGLLALSFLLVMLWLILGKWIDITRFSRSVVSGSSVGMCLLGLMIWFWGTGLPGMLLIIAGGWHGLREIRQSRKQAATDPASSLLLASR